MRLICLLAIAAVAAPLSAQPPAWPQFRGPDASGVADGAKVPTQFSLTKNLAWKVPCPAGLSAPVVAGGKIFLTGFADKKLFTLAYDAKSGAELWRAEAPAEKIEKYHATEGSPAASTCATDGTRVVSYFGSCGLFCYDLGGKPLWSKSMPTAESVNDFGTGTSPVIHDGAVILLRDGPKGAKLLALDAKTGAVKWETPRENAPTSFATPAIWVTPTGTQVVCPGALRLAAYDFATGKELWALPGFAAVPCTTPVVVGGDLVYAAWSPGGADMKMPGFDDVLKADADHDGAINRAESENTFLKGFFDSNDTNKDGKITRDEWDTQVKFMMSGKNKAVRIRPGEASESKLAWTVTKGLPYVPSPLAYRGQMVTVNMRGLVSAFDLTSGAEVYAEESVGLNGVYASPVAADGHIYLFALDGTAVVIKAGDFPEVVGRAKLGERVAATPAPVGGTLYVRGAKHLFAFAAGK